MAKEPINLFALKGCGLPGETCYSIFTFNLYAVYTEHKIYVDITCGPKEFLIYSLVRKSIILWDILQLLSVQRVCLTD